MIRGGQAAALILALGCSSLAEGDNVVAIVVRTPSPAAVEQNDTLRLQATALNSDGDSVAATIVWYAADPSVTVVGTDLLTTNLSSGIGRVQAGVGRLRSELVSYTIRRRSEAVDLGKVPVDTLTVDTVTVAGGVTVSPALEARVISTGTDTVGVPGTVIRYRVVDADIAAAQGTVEFAGGGLEIRATTASDGMPATAVTLRVVPGATPPDSVRVEALAQRPSGFSVPGSGHRFTVIFQ